MTTTTGIANSLTAGRLPKWAPWVLLTGSWAVMSVIFGLVAAGSGAEFNIVLAIFTGTILFDIATVSYTHLRAHETM
jgi:phosphate transport system permease protein